MIFEHAYFQISDFFTIYKKSLGTVIQTLCIAFDAVSKLWNEPLNIDLSNHDLDPTEDFEEALKNDIIIYDE